MYKSMHCSCGNFSMTYSTALCLTRKIQVCGNCGLYPPFDYSSQGLSKDLTLPKDLKEIFEKSLARRDVFLKTSKMLYDKPFRLTPPDIIKVVLEEIKKPDSEIRKEIFRISGGIIQGEKGDR